MSINTYIVIEVREKESALDIMNILMTHTKTRFTCTNDIQEYALERERLCAPQNHPPKQPTPPPPQQLFMEPPPAKKSAVSAEIDEVKPIAMFNPSPQPTSFIQNNSVFPNCYPSEYSSHEFVAAASNMPVERQPMRTVQSNGKLVQVSQCTICSTNIKVRGLDYYKRCAHAIIHTDLMRFDCTIPGCPFKVKHRADVSRHMKTVHRMEVGEYTVRDILTESDQQILRECVAVCFPEMSDRIARKNRDAAKFNEGGSEHDEMEDDYDIDDTSIH
ncbi:unnamed protein product [Caenorhabditis angaria]|uniref:C2H2-type domain-containing protein n=1 Tax=Caenorhabditis angaria TaxID=860376 RepID=A0A9P1I3A1_9PELO|nr:unnamed protein product [Caenorhabditis angaria]